MTSRDSNPYRIDVEDSAEKENGKQATGRRCVMSKNLKRVILYVYHLLITGVIISTVIVSKQKFDELGM